MTTAPLISPTMGGQILQRKADGFLCELDLGRFVRMLLMDGRRTREAVSLLHASLCLRPSGSGLLFILLRLSDQNGGLLAFDRHLARFGGRPIRLVVTEFGAKDFAFEVVFIGRDDAPQPLRTSH